MALAWLCCWVVVAHATVHDIDAYGARRADPIASKINAAALEAALVAAKQGDIVRVTAGKPYFMHGVAVSDVHGVALHIEGEVRIDNNVSSWYAESQNRRKKLRFLVLTNVSNFTVGGGGLIDGQGLVWWDAAITGSVPGIGETRPDMISFLYGIDVVIEHLTLRNSPHFHVRFEQCSRVTVRYVRIDVDRWAQRSVKARAHAKRIKSLGVPWTERAHEIAQRLYGLDVATAGTALGASGGMAFGASDDASVGAGGRAGGGAPLHTGLPGLGYMREDWRDWLLDQLVRLLPAWALQPEDLNTDGIDPSGEGFHIHDCEIHNDDDSIAIKPADLSQSVGCAQHMLLENLVLTGFGASIGSVPPHADVNCVRNITFRNVSMPGTGKGIYVKSNPMCGLGVDRHNRTVQRTALLEDIRFEDVRIDRPFWWPVWIGPQQQHEPGSALGHKCALVYPLFGTQCPTQGCATFRNIHLRNVTVNDPLLSPGVVLGNASRPMQGIVFDGVRVRFGDNPLRGRFPWGRDYMCKAADVQNVAGTVPALQCAGD